MTPHPATKISSTQNLLLYSHLHRSFSENCFFPAKSCSTSSEQSSRFWPSDYFKRPRKDCPSQESGRFLTYYKRDLLAARQSRGCCRVWCCGIGTGPVGVPQPGAAGSVNASEEASLMGAGRLQRSEEGKINKWRKKRDSSNVSYK